MTQPTTEHTDNHSNSETNNSNFTSTESLFSGLARTYMVKSLFEDMLGPRCGPDEVIENPSVQYTMGILNPRLRSSDKPDFNIPPDPYEKANFPDNLHHGDSDFESDETDYKISVDSDLNLMQGAYSMGLSFVVAGAPPLIQICCTWGKYELVHAPGTYKRHPSLMVSDLIDVSKIATPLLPSNSFIHNIGSNDAKLYVYTRYVENNKWHVSIFLVNESPYSGTKPNKRQNNVLSIFQPQIRVICGSDSSVEDLGTPFADKTNNDYLYQNKANKGRGHLCGVMWKDIDPASDSANQDFCSMMWPDAQSSIMPDDVLQKFQNSDIRTEYLPMYVVRQPEIRGNSDRFNADRLADLWDVNSISSTFTPIVTEYKQWISDQQETYSTKNDLLDENIEQCYQCADRIQKGIDLLLCNEKARLAFCFMNEAMHMKHQWDSNDNDAHFSWHTFQIAFILQTLPGLIPDNKQDKDFCDILWFPTGGGKTEAYLGLMAFTFAYRRLVTYKDFQTDGGVSIISRYTLRLLTIQQFSRTLGLILASDMLRVKHWLPRNVEFTDPDLIERDSRKNLWGQNRFSLGLWIGDITPNRFEQVGSFLNAEGALSPLPPGTSRGNSGEPAQITKCPCCGSLLAISDKEITNREIFTITWIVETNMVSEEFDSIDNSKFCGNGHIICKKDGSPAKSLSRIHTNEHGTYCALRVHFRTNHLSSDNIDKWWRDDIMRALKLTKYSVPLQCTRASRPGYFFLYENNSNKRFDFSIHCPNPDCLTWEIPWFEKTMPRGQTLIAKPFVSQNDPNKSISTPISAFTIDPQVYGRCPTVIIATTDKFAQLAFKPEAASIFGNVDTYHMFDGFHRAGTYKDDSLSDPVPNFYPPSLIIQDELHLIEGPLGSMVGLYEIAIDILSSPGTPKIKYIASTATIKESSRQVAVVYRRTARVFPPPGIRDGDNYFSKIDEDPSCSCDTPGRLYIGLLAPRSMLLGLVRIYASLLSSIYRLHKSPKSQAMPANLDAYWTLVGYFNAIRELAIARNLYNSDIIRDVKKLSSKNDFSISHRLDNSQFDPGTRFIPVLLSHDSDLVSITIYCSNESGEMSVALYDNNPIDDTPSKLLSNTTDEFVKRCHKNANELLLETPIPSSRGTLVWVAIHNYSSTTSFQCGASDRKSHITNKFQIKNNKIVFSSVEQTSKIPESIMVSLNYSHRYLDQTKAVELSSSVKSLDLPKAMEDLEKPGKIDALFTTSIFGTGIDIDRLGLMTVVGQPKSTSSYIQSTGRIGRKHPGLVITWLRATRVRDLSHYENFVGYHRAINRFVEPISASPFSEKALKTCLGPIIVAILRNAGHIAQQPVSADWQNNPNYMIGHHKNDEITALCTSLTQIFDSAKTLLSNLSPDSDLPVSSDEFTLLFNDAICIWNSCANRISRDYGDKFIYNQSTRAKLKNHVVLGTKHHQMAGKISAYKNVHYSLRDVEPTFTMGEKWGFVSDA